MGHISFDHTNRHMHQSERMHCKKNTVAPMSMALKPFHGQGTTDVPFCFGGQVLFENITRPGLG